MKIFQLPSNVTQKSTISSYQDLEIEDFPGNNAWRFLKFQVMIHSSCQAKLKGNSTSGQKSPSIKQYPGIVDWSFRNFQIKDIQESNNFEVFKTAIQPP